MDNKPSNGKTRATILCVSRTDFLGHCDPIYPSVGSQLASIGNNFDQVRFSDVYDVQEKNSLTSFLDLLDPRISWFLSYLRIFRIKKEQSFYVRE
jgi:hypothetical protein